MGASAKKRKLYKNLPYMLVELTGVNFITIN